jgi:hypothetical protein
MGTTIFFARVRPINGNKTFRLVNATFRNIDQIFSWKIFGSFKPIWWRSMSDDRPLNLLGSQEGKQSTQGLTDSHHRKFSCALVVVAAAVGFLLFKKKKKNKRHGRQTDHKAPNAIGAPKRHAAPAAMAARRMQPRISSAVTMSKSAWAVPRLCRAR